MQIDFHYYAIYVIARLAGFKNTEANIIATSSQMVDDATDFHTIFFSNGEKYRLTCSAHKALDYRNFEELSNSSVWIPFHFLPGNIVSPGMEPNSKLICRQNSEIAQMMVKECIRLCNEPNSLYRLGITLHVFADTWAHQGFSGIQSNHNRVTYLHNDALSKNLINRMKQFFEDKFDTELCTFIDEILPLGHGAALSFPDLPYLEWRYKTIEDEIVKRNNSDIFVDAVKNIYFVMRSYQDNNYAVKYDSPYPLELTKFKALFTYIDDEIKEIRCNKWRKEIKAGTFSFGVEDIEYIGYKDIPKTYLEFKNSDFKKFQDALHMHIDFINNKLLPSYEIIENNKEK